MTHYDFFTAQSTIMIHQLLLWIFPMFYDEYIIFSCIHTSFISKSVKLLGQLNSMQLPLGIKQWTVIIKSFSFAGKSVYQRSYLKLSYWNGATIFLSLFLARTLPNLYLFLFFSEISQCESLHLQYLRNSHHFHIFIAALYSISQELWFFSTFSLFLTFYLWRVT